MLFMEVIGGSWWDISTKHLITVRRGLEVGELRLRGEGLTPMAPIMSLWNACHGSRVMLGCRNSTNIFSRFVIPDIQGARSIEGWGIWPSNAAEGSSRTSPMVGWARFWIGCIWLTGCAWACIWCCASELPGRYPPWTGPDRFGVELGLDAERSLWAPQQLAAATGESGGRDTYLRLPTYFCREGICENLGSNFGKDKNLHTKEGSGRLVYTAPPEAETNRFGKWPVEILDKPAHLASACIV